MRVFRRACSTHWIHSFSRSQEQNDVSARLRSEKLNMRCTCCLLILTLWSAAAGCNNHMPMCIGSFSLHSNWIGLSKRYPNSAVLRRDVEIDRLIGNRGYDSNRVRYLPFTKVVCWFASYCLLTFSLHFLHFLDGSTKKRQADQQAAKVALQHLSGILSCPPISDTEKNFKGVLKEHLDQLGLKNPVYDTDNKAEVNEEPMSTDISSDLITSTVSICEAAVKDHSESVGISTSAQLPSCQESVHVHVPVQPDPPDSSTPASLRKKPKIDCPGMEHVGRKMMCYCRRHK